MTTIHSRRVSWSGGLLGLVIITALTWQLVDAWRDSQTFDEGGHLVSGVSYWQEKNFAFNNTHPPLTKWLAGLPVVLLTDARVDTSHDPEKAYIHLLYESPQVNWFQTLLFLGRFPFILIWLGLLFVIFAWSKERWGQWAGVLAASLFAFDPSFLGHGHLINTDVPVTALYIATLWLADRFFRRPAWLTLWLLTAAFGLALSTKFSAILLVPLLPALGLVRHWYDRQSFSWTWWWRMVSMLMLGGFGIVWALYGFEIQHGVPAWNYWQGLHSVYLHNDVGHEAFLLGQTSSTGWWNYFPLAIFFKTPIITLSMLALVVGNGLYRRIQKSEKPKGFKPLVPWEFWTMVFPALLWLGVGMSSQLNIGIRHVFPVYPFIFIGLGSVVTLLRKRWWGWAVTTVTAVSVTISLLAYPHTLSYFNGLVGGSNKGDRLLLDSNLDWGQDAWRLRRWLTENHISVYSLELYGSIPEQRVFPEARRVLTNADIAAGLQPEGVIIASRGAVEEPSSAVSWLKQYQPVERLWSTILLYRFPSSP